MRIALIAAASDNGIIGSGMRLPWHLPADLRHFKALTLGHHLIMGRRTFESIGRALPGRTTIVLTRDPDWTAPGVEVSHSLAEALHLASTAGESEVFVAGGGQVYHLALPVADVIYLTRVHTGIEGDTRFPRLDEDVWRIVSRQHRAADEKNAHDMTFQELHRVEPGPAGERAC